MKKNIEVTAYHGWGFDSSWWDCWLNVLPPSAVLKKFDRGYYGSELQPVKSDKSEYNVLFLHSFGLHLIAPEEIESADLVVVFCGFTSFHPTGRDNSGDTHFAVRSMIQKMRKEPETVIRDFLRNCYHPGDPPDFEPETIEREKLIEDLKLLDQSVLDLSSLKKADKICILHGSEDMIVHNDKGRELYGHLRSNASYFEIKNAGHALPFTMTKECWSFIRPEFSKVISD